MKKQFNWIQHDVVMMPDLMIDQAEKIYQEIREEIPSGILESAEHIIITGCGYSRVIAMNAKSIFEAIAGVSTEDLFSVDASRHKVMTVLPAGKKTVVIGISNSGVVARIAETLQRYRRAGYYTIAFTRDRQSACGQAAEQILKAEAPQSSSPLPLRNYLMGLLYIYGMAWNMAVIRNPHKETERLAFYKKMERLAAELNDTMPQILNQVQEFGKLASRCSACEFVGSGTEYAASWMGKQLLVGQTGKIAVDCSLEDWLHSDFFMSNPEQIATVLFQPSNSLAYSRIAEVHEYMNYMKRPLCVIADRKFPFAYNQYDVVVPYSQDALLNPLVDFIPISLLAGDICERIGEWYSRGFRIPWDFSKDGKATQFSKIEII